MDTDTEAKKVLVKHKHVKHEETLAKIIRELQYNIEHYNNYTGPESIFEHVKANAEALLFLCQERKRDRDRHKRGYTKAVFELPPPGSDLL